MAIKGNMKYATLDVVFGKHGLVKAENKREKKKKIKGRCYYFAVRNGKTLLPIGRVLKQ